MTALEVAAARRQAVIDTLRYLADGGRPHDPVELRQWALDVENASPSSSCCPFCAEVVCDDDCPLEPSRRSS